MLQAEAALTAEVLEREVGRRRNFAIISHPDAGKTTMTEKCELSVTCMQAAMHTACWCAGLGCN